MHASTLPLRPLDALTLQRHIVGRGRSERARLFFCWLNLSGLLCSFAGSGPLDPSTPLACAAPWQGVGVLQATPPSQICWQGVDVLQATSPSQICWRSEADVVYALTLVAVCLVAQASCSWAALMAAGLHVVHALVVVHASCSGAALTAAGLHLVHALHSENLLAVCIVVVYSLTT